MSNLKAKKKVMMPAAGSEKVETPFGTYDPLEDLINDTDMARFLNDTAPDAIVEFVTPDDIVKAIAPMAKHSPRIEGEDSKVVVLALFNAELTIECLDGAWSIDEPTDKLIAEITTDKIKIVSYELLNRLNQESYESIILIDDNGALVFRRTISLEQGVTQLNLLCQLNSYIGESTQIIEQVTHGELD